MFILLILGGLFASQLHRLAGILGLPTSLSLASTRQLIEGKLLEMGCEPKNVQVIESDEDARLHVFGHRRWRDK